LPILAWVSETDKHFSWEVVARRAMYNNRINVLEWLVKKYPRIHLCDAGYSFTGETETETLAWLYENGQMDNVLDSGLLDKRDVALVERILRAGCPWEAYHTRFVIDNGLEEFYPIVERYTKSRDS
jgi:hypothetical protein